MRLPTLQTTTLNLSLISPSGGSFVVSWCAYDNVTTTQMQSFVLIKIKYLFLSNKNQFKHKTYSNCLNPNQSTIQIYFDI